MAAPARGFERVICKLAIALALILLIINIIVLTSHWIAYVAPLIMMLVALARLKGWVQRGSGGGGGGP